MSPQSAELAKDPSTALKRGPSDAGLLRQQSKRREPPIALKGLVTMQAQNIPALPTSPPSAPQSSYSRQ